MRTKIALISALALAMAGCSGMKKGDGDMYYKIVDNKSGGTIQEDDFIDITYTETTDDGVPITGSYVLDQPTLLFRERPRFQGDFFSALAQLSEGDSAIVKVNIDSAVKRVRFIKPKGSKGKYLIYHVRVNKVIGRNGLNDSAYNNKIENYKKIFYERCRQAEPAKLKKYIAAQPGQPVFTPSGLGYILNRTGKGKPGVKGDTVLLNYSASYLSGIVFETNKLSTAKQAGIYNHLRPYQTIKMILQGGTKLSGFDEALHKFPAGTQVKLIIPSKLAYGADGSNRILPYTPLLCDLEILKILPVAHSATRQQPIAQHQQQLISRHEQ